MITGPKHYFKTLCIERGYTLEQVRPCIIQETDEDITVDETHPSYPNKKKGLGDWIELILSYLGITKSLISKVIGRQCGCKKRQDILNRIGKKIGIG